MLTNTMPAVIQALSQVLPASAVSQIAQALGNCNQPLTQRSGLSVLPGATNSTNGVVNGGNWNPADYPGLLPDVNTINNINGGNDLRNYANVNNYNNDYSSHLYGGPSFNFPTSNEFLVNEYYGGPTTYVGGNSEFTNTVTTNLTVTNNFTTNTINGEPVQGGRGPAGPAGSPGAAGAPGAPGAPGANGISILLPGIAGKDGKDGKNATDNMRTISVWGGAGRVYAKGTITVERATFNAETCTLDYTPEEIPVELDVRGLVSRQAYSP